MSAQIVGSVKSGGGKSYDVKWDSLSKEVYVSWGGRASVGKAYSASEAMNKNEVYLYNK
ncbi:MAG: hypothetical protein Q8M94_21900 [Ignavibacteria bacterium]|nr:hypothetical protein [Ignavibacteria bacterium]